VTEPWTSFAQLLRQLRTRAGLTQDELATAAGLSSRAVSDLERGVNRSARRETTRLLADALRLVGPARVRFEAAARGRPPGYGLGTPGGLGRPADAGEAAAAAPAAAVQLFPVVIGHYSDPAWPELDLEAEAGRLQDLLAGFGAAQHKWGAPVKQRGAGAVERRLRDWAESAGRPDTPPSTLLYWAGHGSSDGTRAALAHADSPNPVGEFGVTPEELAHAIRARQAALAAREAADGAGDGQGWALVVVDASRAGRFVQLLVAALDAYPDPPRRVLLLGVDRDDATAVARFSDVLRTALTTTFKADERIMLTDLADQLQRLLGGSCVVRAMDGLNYAALVPVTTPVASQLAASLDVLQHLEEVLEELEPDERRHFLVKAQGAEHGELSWFFEGRERERARITAWLRQAGSGMLVVTGRAGSGKSALLGNVLVHSLPGLRDALARRGLIAALPPDQALPDDVFDVAIHLSGLTLTQVTSRVAAAAGLGPLPSQSNPGVGIATDLDWLADRLSERSAPFTVLADALDEAPEPLETAFSLLARIAALPGVRVLVGTRASTSETPDAPAADEDLLDALAADPAASGTRDGRAAGGGASLRVWVGSDREAIRRYVSNRLRAAREHGVAGRAVPDLAGVRDEDIERVAAEVSDRDREFLFARLAVYELIASPRLLTPGRAWSLRALLDGGHQDLFARALLRLADHDDRYPILLQALSLARGRGVPEADGIWAIIAATLAPAPEPGAADPDRDPAWALAIGRLLEQAAAYIAVDTHAADYDVGGDPGNPASRPGLSGRTGSETVYRLAHRTFVEYFTAHAGTARQALAEHRRRAASALLSAANRIAANCPSRIPPYLARHLSGHAADAGLWDELADHPRVLDGLDPQAVTADATRTLLGRRSVPAPVAGVVGAREALARAMPADRAGLRQLATAIHSQRQVLDEETVGWGVAAAQAGSATMHVRLAGHTGAVCKVRSLTLPDGRLALASAAYDGTIRLWDPLAAAPIGTPVAAHADTVEDICVITQPAGPDLLASVGGDGLVRIWDPATGRPIGEPLRGHDGHVLGVCELPDDDDDPRTLVASGGIDGTVRIWDLALGCQVDELRGHTGAVYGLCALPGQGDGGRSLLASVGEDGTVRIWDPALGRQVGDPLRGHDAVVYSVCVLPGQDVGGRTLLASAGEDGTVRIWDLALGRQIGEPLRGHAAAVYSVCVLPGYHVGGRTMLATAGEDGTVRIWDLAVGREIGEPLRGHAGRVWGVCALPGRDALGRPDGRTLLATSGHDGTARIWDPAVGREIGGSRRGRIGLVWGICAVPGQDQAGQPDGRTLLAITGHDGSTRIWDPATSRQVGEPLSGHTARVWGICAVPGQDPDGQPGGRTLLATAGQDGTARIWDPATGQQVGEPMSEHTGPVYGICALPDQDPGGRTLVVSTGDDGTARIWDPATGRRVGEPLRGHNGHVWSACALPDQETAGHSGTRTLVVTGGDDGTARIWDPATGQQVGEPLRGHVGHVYGVCALRGQPPDGRTLIATGGIDGTARIWDPATGQQVGEPLRGHVGHIWGGCALPGQEAASFPGEDLLVTSGDDGTMRIWDPATGQQVGESLRGHIGGVWGLCTLPGLDPDGRVLIATTGDDGTGRVWDPVTGHAVGEPLVVSPDTVNGLASCAAPGYDCVCVTGDGALRTWDAATASFTQLLSAWRASAVGMSAGLDSDALLTGDTTGLLHVNDMATGRALRPPAATGAGTVLAVCPVPGQPARVAVAGRRGTIAVFSLTDSPGAEPAFPAHNGPVRDLCLIERAGGPPLLASAGNDGTIRIWDTGSWAPHGDPLTGHEGWIWSIASISGAVPRLASAGADGTVRLWDPLSGQQIGQPLAGHTDQVRAVTYVTSIDGRTLLVSGSHDCTVRLWHPGTGAAVYRIPLRRAVHALLQQKPDRRSVERTDGGTTVTVGLRTGILALDLHSSLFPGARAMLPAGSTLACYY
jgi:WD40 repeat protein/transcriptional regulator with XRE-family HTH domain